MDTPAREAWLSTGNELEGGRHCHEIEQDQTDSTAAPHCTFSNFWSFQAGPRGPPSSTQSFLPSPGVMILLLDMAAPPWCLCASDSLIQGHHMQEAPSYVLCSLQRGIPSHSLPREGLLSLNRPQRKLPSARPWDGRTERPSCWPWAEPAGGPATMGSMRKSASLSSGYHG